MFVQLPLILFLFLLIFFLCYFIISFFTGAPFVVTPKHIINEMLTIADLKKTDVVYDLGSGDGRILITTAKQGAHAEGWEINPVLVLWTKLMAKMQSVENKVQVYNKPYQTADLKHATIIIFYNIPGHLPSLEEKLQKELKRGTKILSYKFPLKTFTLKKQSSSGIFLYTKI